MIKKYILHLLIISILHISCASIIYDVKHLDNNKSVIQKIKNKRVEIYMQDHKKYIGFLTHIDGDSLKILISEAEKKRNIQLSLKDVKAIKIKKHDTAIAVAFIVGLTVFYFLIKANVSAAKSGTQ